MPKYMNKKAKKSKFFNLNKIILIICIIVFLYSVIRLSVWFINNNQSQKVNREIREKVVEEVAVNKEEDFNKIDFESLKQINQDVVAYIEIPDTNISYPILQANDNEYYLNHDINRKYNSCGAIFLDKDNTSNFKDDNTVIYGHHLTRGTMFTELEKIQNNTLSNDIYINIYTENGNIKYKVFSSYIAAPENALVTVDINNKTMFIQETLKRSEIDFRLLPNEDDKILTLYTCDSSMKNRIIVHAVKII